MYERPAEVPADQGHPPATVLIVDDEPDECEIMARILERRGYATLTAGHPNDAVALCEDHQQGIDLLLTDLGMPGASGGDLARLVTDLRPELRVLYVSGLPRELAVHRGLIAHEAAILQKPFSSSQLVEAVQLVLADSD